MIAEIGASALPKDKLEQYNKITTQMAKIYIQHCKGTRLQRQEQEAQLGTWDNGGPC